MGHRCLSIFVDASSPSSMAATPGCRAVLGQPDERGALVPAQGGGQSGAGAAGRRSQVAPLEAHADFILAEVAAAPDVTLEELRAKLIDAHGARFGLTTIWRFFDRRAITYKKRPHMPQILRQAQ